jgi:NAD-dependent dihydropyrimidine dehydrogenase PreA subunit
MIREVVKINETLCDGCGLCIPGCHEGALQVIDGKARLIGDLMCDGLGACLGHCPQGAITIEKREAEAYNESKVMEIIDEIHEDQPKVRTHTNLSHKPAVHPVNEHHPGVGGCPGSAAISFEPKKAGVAAPTVELPSELRHWPVQLHLVNPAAPYYRDADVVIAADCTAFALGDFHSRFLKGKSLAIACPKLDSRLEMYVEKITRMIDEARINTLTVIIMEVPCCEGLLQMTKAAAANAKRKVPIKMVVVGLEGNVLREEWG